MYPFTIRPNADTVIFKMLWHFGKLVSQDQLASELHIHPDYPDLLAMSDVLNNFGLVNSAYRVGTNDLFKITLPFIAHTRKKNSEYLLVSRITDQFLIANNGNKKVELTFDEFNQISDGIILAAENLPSKLSLPIKFKAHVRKTFYPLVIICFMGLSILSLIFCTNFLLLITWPLLGIILIKTIGLCTSILLLIQTIDNNNPLIKKLCNGTKSNCNAILNSKAAKVFEGLSWSEVGFFYFAGTWLTLLLTKNMGFNTQVISLLNFASLPYTFYSLYYQLRTKQWCILCCTIQAMLWLEFFLLLPINVYPLSILNTRQLLSTALCLCFPTLLWFLVKPVLLQFQQKKPLQDQLRRFKYNTKVFNTLLIDQPKHEQPDDDWSIVLGNVEADCIVTIVSDPYCLPCSKAHQQLDELLKNNTDVQFRIVFTVENHENDRKTIVVRHFMALKEAEDQHVLIEALHDWYNQGEKSYEAWAKRYPIALDKMGAAYSDKLGLQKEWCRAMKIKATPTFMINGNDLPDIYQLKDIKYMLA